MVTGSSRARRVSERLITLAAMENVFLGSEAIDRNELTWGQLRCRYRPIYPDVYMRRFADRSLHANTVGAWLWCGRRARITGPCRPENSSKSGS